MLRTRDQRSMVVLIATILLLLGVFALIKPIIALAVTGVIVISILAFYLGYLITSWIERGDR